MIKRIEDIDKRKKEEMKKEFTDDVTDVVEDIFNNVEDFFKRKRIEREIVEQRRSKWWRIGKKIFRVSWICGLIILILNFILGNIWLLKTLIKTLLK